MSKFDAGTAVEVMEFDFTTFGGKSGVIPEPSTKEIEDFFNGIRGMVKELKATVKESSGVEIEELQKLGQDGTEGEELKEEALAALESLSESMLSTQQDRMAGLLAQVCKQQPSFEDLQRLPYRVFAQFQKWFMGEIRPKADGTNR